jgi:hypothetical protein
MSEHSRTKPGGIPRLRPEAISLLSYGFRPFFLSAALWACIAMVLWIGLLSGWWTFATGYGAIAWHAHEFLFGYIAAVMTGFLLTAIPNWTGRFPLQGRPLLALLVLWLAGRAAMLATNQIGTGTAAIIDGAYLVMLTTVITREIIAGSNWRNLRVAVLAALTAVALPAGRRNMGKIIGRVKAILLTPQTEWLAIVREPDDTAALFAGYVAILALIPALAGFIGVSLIGGYWLILPGLISAVVSYLLSFVAVVVIALIIDALAPTFLAQKNFPNAVKPAVYSYTPVWLVGIIGLFPLIPGLSFLTILGLYGFYLLWLGMPPLMQAPRDKALPYAGAVVLCALVMAILIRVVQVTIY